MKLFHLSSSVVLLAGLAAFIAWASAFEIDETVRARGKIVVQGRVQIVQTAEGGVLKSLEVQEGDSVSAGQLLAVMDADAARAAVEEIGSEIDTNTIAKLRAEAELVGKEPVFGELGERYPDVAAAQLAMYEGNIAAMNSEIEFTMRQRDIAAEQLSSLKDLASSGDVSRAEVARAERDLIQIDGTLVQIVEKYRVQARKEIAAIEQQISTLRFRLEGRETSLDFSRLVSPQDGIVTLLKTNTLGAVLRAGDELMRISPTKGERIVEVQIAPMDVGRLEIGHEVAIQFDSFPSTIYGNLSGTLTYVSADALTDAAADGRAHSYYLARIKLDRLQHNNRIGIGQLKPGMELTVDIKTGQRTVLTYLAKPILRAFSGALSEK